MSSKGAPRKRPRSSTAGGASTSSSSSKRKPVEKADDLDIVLKQCRSLKEELRQKASKSVASRENEEEQDEIPAGIVEVTELSSTEVLEGIEGIALTIASQVMACKGFSMEIPSRAASVGRPWWARFSYFKRCLLKRPFVVAIVVVDVVANQQLCFFSTSISHLLQNQVYVKAWDRIVLGGKRSARSFMNVKESRKSAITLRVMQLLHAVLDKRIHITKRDLFYTDVKLFVDQAESDGVLDDVATMIGCTRSNLHVVASDKGLVVGRIQFEEDGDPIDCTRMGVGGKAIPPYIDKIENIRSDAEFVLLVEKEAAYMRMAVSVMLLSTAFA